MQNEEATGPRICSRQGEERFPQSIGVGCHSMRKREGIFWWQSSLGQDVGTSMASGGHLPVRAVSEPVCGPRALVSDFFLKHICPMLSLKNIYNIINNNNNKFPVCQVLFQGFYKVFLF